MRNLNIIRGRDIHFPYIFPIFIIKKKAKDKFTIIFTYGLKLTKKINKMSLNNLKNCVSLGLSINNKVYRLRHS
jgi:hypothetical protein